MSSHPEFAFFANQILTRKVCHAKIYQLSLCALLTSIHLCVQKFKMCTHFEDIIPQYGMILLIEKSAAFEKKNLTRKKFGLKPITMEEFLEIENQVKELEIEQQKKAATAAAEAMELERARQQKENRGGFLGKLFGDALKDTCESNYDCERPEVCCDFGIKKMCCSSGMLVTNGPNNRKGELALVPVPITNPNPYPPNDPRNRDPYFG